MINKESNNTGIIRPDGYNRYLGGSDIFDMLFGTSKNNPFTQQDAPLVIQNFRNSMGVTYYPTPEETAGIAFILKEPGYDARVDLSENEYFPAGFNAKDIPVIENNAWWNHVADGGTHGENEFVKGDIRTRPENGKINCYRRELLKMIGLAEGKLKPPTEDEPQALYGACMANPRYQLSDHGSSIESHESKNMSLRERSLRIYMLLTAMEKVTEKTLKYVFLCDNKDNNTGFKAMKHFYGYGEEDELPICLKYTNKSGTKESIMHAFKYKDTLYIAMYHPLHHMVLNYEQSLTNINRLRQV